MTYASPDTFAAVDQVMGPEIPSDFPKRYSENLHHVDIFNAHISFTLDEFVRWQRRYDVVMKQEFSSIFEGSFKRNQVVASTLVEHPTVAHPERFKDACSVVLQRAVILSDPEQERETIFLRSYLHSVDDSGKGATNFVPRGGFQVSFPSKTVWFPLELTTGISEPTAFVVLDILTTKPLDEKGLPTSFRVAKTAEMTFHGKSYKVFRVTAQLDTKQKWEDLNANFR